MQYAVRHYTAHFHCSWMFFTQIKRVPSAANFDEFVELFRSILDSYFLQSKNLLKNINNNKKIVPENILTITPLTWRIWWAPSNASKWPMGFNSAFKGLMWSNNPCSVKNECLLVFLLHLNLKSIQRFRNIPPPPHRPLTTNTTFITVNNYCRLFSYLG